MKQKTRQAELHQDFVDEADRRWAAFRKSGKAIPWEAMRDYLRKRAAGVKVRAPKARKA